MNIRPRFSKIVSCLIILLLTGTTLAAARITTQPAITLTINEPQYSFGSTQLADGTYATITASTTDATTTTLGAPKLPVINYLVEIPEAATPVLTITQDSWTETSLAAQGQSGLVAPVQPSLVKEPGATVPFTFDAMLYATNAYYPTTTASIQTVGYIRGHRVALIQVSPVQYNPVTGALRLLNGCTVSVSLPGSDMDKTHAILSRYDAPSFVTQEQSLFTNYGMLEAGTNGPKSEGYLILVDDNLQSAIQPFADWKASLGFDVTVTLTSQIPGGVTKEHIYTYFKDAYENWSNPPVYILLVGDTPQIPTYTGSETNTCTDLYFVTVNGTDYFADIYIGRFSAATADQVTAMVDKTLYYEQGIFPDNAWLKHAVFMASNDNYQVSEGTHNYVISTYLDPAGWTSDKLYCHTYGATPAEVSAALNDGRNIAIYSGHGAETYWADGPVFYQSDVNALTNDGLYPFVCSHACLTNQFTVSECFGETWIRASHKGGLAFWGATTYSYWDEDDILERAMFQAWWSDNIEFLCGMTNQALLYLYQHYAGGGMTLYYFQEYNLLGDPSHKIWKDDPNPNLPPAIPGAPTGPTQGISFLTYSFNATATADPEGQQVFLKFSFGDGNESDFLGPYSPGQIATASHAWSHNGTYQVKALAKDINGSQSGWSDPLAITIKDLPKLNITGVKGGIAIHVTVKNRVDQDLKNVLWDVKVKAPMLLTYGDMNGLISTIPGSGEYVVKTGWLVGFGPLTLTIKVGDATCTASGLLLGPFAVGVKA